MKSVSILALVGAVSATSFNDFPGFGTPDSSDNTCNSQQETGWDWTDLTTGSFSSYGGFSFSGFTCTEGYAKRDPNSRFAPRTSKSISGSCGHTVDDSPSFSCSGSSDVSSFSVTEIQVVPEFDCDLEFHYDMPDGSSCKQRSSCSSSGSTITNSQCGGATNVTIVYPSGQGNVPQSSSTCSVAVPTISFDCSSASSTVVKTTQSSSSTVSTKVKTTSTEAIPTASGHSQTYSQSTVVKTTSSESQPTGKGSSTAYVTSATSTATTGKPTPSEESSVSSASTESTITSNSPASSSVESVSSTIANSSIPATVPAVEISTTYEVTSTHVTSYVGTSTVYSTQVQTITSCAPEVTNCPANSASAVTTTVVIAVSTTICPITETQTTVLTTSRAVTATPTAGVPAAETTSSAEKTITSNSPAQSSASSDVASGTTTVVTTATEALPCPTVVPQCVSTWMFIVGCVDNSDTDCYCPDATFVQNVYDCLYAHGDADETVSEAVSYFQGICGGYGNPAVATGATVTTYLTATATAAASAVYTTIVVQATTVVPCTNSVGSVIPGSSSTSVLSTVITVPQVALSTVVISSSTEVGVIPVTSYVTKSVAVTTQRTATATGSASASAITSNSPVGGSKVPSGVAAGTGSYTTATTTAGAIVTAGAGRVGAGFGAALAVMGVVAAL